MADAPNTVSTLNGLFKEVYGEKVVDLIPEGVKIQKKIPFVQKQKQNGNKYHQPVQLAYEQGFTFAGPSAGAFDLNDAAAGVTKDATVLGSQVLLKSQIDYETAARAAKGRNAFIDATALMFESMQKSMRKKLEVLYLYGQSGIGTVSAVSTNDLTISAGEWAPGIWMGAEGMSIDVYNGSTKRGSCKVVSVNPDTRVISVDAAPGGTAANDVLYFKGAYNQEMAGIAKILGNTGELFDIDASVYTLWKATSYSAGSAALTQAKVGSAVARAVAKGLDDDLLLLVNPDTWNNLLTDQAALVRHKGQGIQSVVTNGSKSIEFFSQNGKITIEPHICVKAGHALGMTPSNWQRLGATDVTFQTPGYEGQIFLHIPTKAGFEVRAYANTAIFCEAPAKNLIITGITNS